MRLTKAVARLLELERVCRIATINVKGMPHLVPVCHVVRDGKIYFASGKRGAKVRNLRANPQIAVTVDLYADAWAHLKGVMVQGTVTLIERGPRFTAIRAHLYRKYEQYAADAAIDPSDSVIVEVTPSHVFSWGVK